MKIFTISSIENSKFFCEKVFKDSSPFISYDFFKYLEKTGCTNSNTGWEPEHIIIESNKKNIGFIPNFRKQNSNGEYIFDHVFANAHHQIGIITTQNTYQQSHLLLLQKKISFMEKKKLT